VTPVSVLGDRRASRVVIDDSGCWIWTGSRNPGGYGQTRDGARMTRVHQIAFVAAKGPVPDGLEIDHLCRVPACCNPDHLEAVTHAENIRRGSQDRKRPEPRTHCARGHELTDENCVRRKDGRQCRTCHNANRRMHDARRRAEARTVMVGVLADAPEGSSHEGEKADTAES